MNSGTTQSTDIDELSGVLWHPLSTSTTSRYKKPCLSLHKKYSEYDLGSLAYTLPTTLHAISLAPIEPPVILLLSFAPHERRVGTSHPGAPDPGCQGIQMVPCPFLGYTCIPVPLRSKSLPYYMITLIFSRAFGARVSS